MFSQAQDQKFLEGIITDSLSGKPIPYATIVLKEKMLGATTNEEGAFRLRLPENVGLDTLVISSMGFKSLSVPVLELGESLFVKLPSLVYSIDEVIIKPYPPEHYIKLVQRNLEGNYANIPFGTQAYYREQLLENESPIMHSEAIFLSYYPEYSGDKENQHQVALFREREDIVELEFMKKRREKHEKKQIKKAKKKGEEISEEEINMIRQMGGPDQLLDLNFLKRPHLFLDSIHFKKYDYNFLPNTVFDGHDIMVIAFEANRNIQHMRTRGKIYIDLDSYAIASLEYYGQAIIPAYVKPLLFAYGLGIKNPTYDVRLNFRKVNELWYPDQVFMDIQVDLTHKRLFKKNTHSHFDMEAFFGVNELIVEDPRIIPLTKRFEGGEKIEDQINPESGISWQGVSVVTKRDQDP